MNRLLAEHRLKQLSNPTVQVERKEKDDKLNKGKSIMLIQGETICMSFSPFYQKDQVKNFPSEMIGHWAEEGHKKQWHIQKHQAIHPEASMVFFERQGKVYIDLKIGEKAPKQKSFFDISCHTLMNATLDGESLILRPLSAKNLSDKIEHLSSDEFFTLIEQGTLSFETSNSIKLHLAKPE